MGYQLVTHVEVACEGGREMVRARPRSARTPPPPPSRRRDDGTARAAIRVVIGEPERSRLSSLALIVRAAGFGFVGAAQDADSLLGLVESCRPDLVVADMRIPSGRRDGTPAAVEVLRRRPGTRLLVLAHRVEHRYLEALLGDRPAGVGYLLRNRIRAVDTLVAAMETVAAGGAIIDDEVAAALRERGTGAHVESGALTPRQREILALMAEGLSNAGIAARLHLSEKTVVHHCSAIYAALDLAPSSQQHRRVLAVVRHLSGAGA